MREKVIKKQDQRVVKYWLPVISWMIIIFSISSIHRVQIDSLGALDFVFRKIAHMIEFGVLSILMARAFFQHPAVSRPWLASLVLSALYAGSDEWHQTYISGRNGAPIDACIDCFGIILGLMWFFEWRAKKKSRA